MKQKIQTSQAPDAVGPYSQAIATDGYVFTAGQIPLSPSGKELVSDAIEEQTHQVIRNLAAVLEAAGLSLADVVKTTIFLTDLKAFPQVNEIYAGYFKEPFPARSTVQVAALPLGARVEIEAIAQKDDDRS